MKVAITGHTSGLGLEIYQHMETLGHSVIGLSRSNGYSLPNDIDKIVNIGLDCDLFFNNAHVGLNQATLISRLFDHTCVITSGSMGADYTHFGNQYYIEKRIIENTHRSLKKKTNNPMLLLKMGYLENYNQPNNIPYTQILNAIDFWLSSPRATVIEFDNINR